MLPLGECSIFLRFLLPTHTSALTEWVMNFFSAATSATSMDVDKVPGDEETDDATTSKAGMPFRS